MASSKSGNTKTEDSVEPSNMTKEKANNFNNYFAPIGAETLNKMGLSVQEFEPTSTQGFMLEEVSPKDVVEVISRMKTNTAVGHDQIPAKIIKDLAETLSTTISELVNLSFTQSKFPHDLKHAVVRPIFKNKGTEEDPHFYRPISVLTAISKIFERIASNQIVKYLEDQKKFYISQHAYRQHHSTTTSLVELTDYIYNELENSNIPAIVSTDLSKAFDTVAHDLLLEKLEKMGFHEQSTRWIKSYLEKRTQVTKFASIESDRETVKSGVPQGSILGPVLFIAYTSDMAEAMPDCKIVAYADDAAILVSAKSIKVLRNKIKKCLSSAQEWYTSNGLLLNPTKTEFMIMGRSVKMEVEVEDMGRTEKIVSRDHLKVLGVKIDENLTWINHINQVRSRTSLAIRNIARTSSTLSLDSRRLLTEALVTPHYNYCDIIYDGCSKQAKNSLQRNQHYAAKSLLNRAKYSSATTALNDLRWIPLEDRRRVHLGVFVHKALKGKSSQHSTSNISSLLPKHKHQTRQKETRRLESTQHRSALVERSIFYRATKVWNDIPAAIRNTSSTKTFKDQYQIMLLTNYKSSQAK